MREKNKKKVGPTPGAKEVTGTTPNPRTVPMETRVGRTMRVRERESDERKGEGKMAWGGAAGCWRQGSVAVYLWESCCVCLGGLGGHYRVVPT